jgi:lipoprotein-anchoring transpeptidase ErfK/SrfK
MNVRILRLLITGLFLGVTIDGAWASIAVRIQLSLQNMTVTVDGTEFATWPVSTARRGYRTPVGIYRPYLLERMHCSKLYDHTPMPHSIFFQGGYAVHGTNEIRNLGRPVSHGCVRLSPENAK